MTQLFQPLALKSQVISNRIGMSPMSMYTATDGIVGGFDSIHYGARAMGGAGLVFTGTAAVLANGRITPKDPGIWDDEFISGLANIAQSIKEFGGTAGIQIGHAGRKASTTVPWQGGGPKQDGRSLTEEEGAWETVAPSALAFGADKTHTPKALQHDEILDIIQAFGLAAKRANEAGFDVLEIHGGHGYLLNQFYSPLTNKRMDEWGGSFAGRIKLTLAVIKEVRRFWPENKPLILRFAMDDFHTGGWNTTDALSLAKLAVEHGVDGFDLMSFGTIAPGGNVPWDKPFIREHAKLLKATLPNTMVMFSAQSAPDMRTEPAHIAELVDSGDADVVLLGRQLLANAHWPSEAASELAPEKILLPNQYEHWLTGRSK
jgi:2,4-dienoyl-CoA reductase-like NADH-dependent reductase (Old Yellow Enzyme family)